MRPKTIGYYVTDERNRGMQWIHDQNNYGFYYTSEVTVFKTRPQAKRHIVNDLKAFGRDFGYQIFRLTEIA